MPEIKQIITRSIEAKSLLLSNDTLIKTIEDVVTTLVQTFRIDGKVLFCGNGGSAADAQHLAAELSGRFYLDRKPLFAEALHTNSSHVTAVANDYGYDEVFSRLVTAMGRKGDVLIAISTSGNSQNIIKAIETAKKAEMLTVGFTGEKGGKMKDMCTYLVNVPSNDTPRIQECHILVGHIICELVEKKLFQK
ncbi:D-sedoheptulose 7-phosphate isomerase [bacterium]|nr:MAG: D-sedoheptulose 7-phosphate isomerase [bacterium]